MGEVGSRHCPRAVEHHGRMEDRVCRRECAASSTASESFSTQFRTLSAPSHSVSDTLAAGLLGGLRRRAVPSDVQRPALCRVWSPPPSQRAGPRQHECSARQRHGRRPHRQRRVGFRVRVRVRVGVGVRICRHLGCAVWCACSRPRSIQCPCCCCCCCPGPQRPRDRRHATCFVAPAGQRSVRHVGPCASAGAQPCRSR